MTYQQFLLNISPFILVVCISLYIAPARKYRYSRAQYQYTLRQKIGLKVVK